STLADGTENLAGGRLPMSARQLPERGVRRDIDGVANADLRFPISLAAESEYRVWSGFDFTADPPSEMHAEEWEAGIGHGIDERSNQSTAFWFQPIVFAAKRDNPPRRFRALQPSHAIGEQSAARDQITRLHFVVIRLDDDWIAARTNRLNARAHSDRSSACDDESGKLGSDAAEVDD